MATNYLITGGDSICAQLLMGKLIELGNVVHAIFPSPKQVPMNLLGKINLKFCFIDLDQCANFDKNLPHSVDVIYHCYEADTASKSNTKLFIGNALSTLYLLDWAKKIRVKEFILCSSGIIYGGGDGKFLETDRPRPVSFSISTKYTAEMLAGFYQKLFNIKILRIFFPYGPAVNHGLICEMINHIKAGSTFDLPYQKITPIYVTDLVEIFLKLCEVEGSMILNVCGSEVIELADAVQTIGQAVGKTPNIKGKPKFSLIGNNKKLVELTNFSFTETFESGLQKMLATN